jgi:hypothetical protein
MLCQLDQLSSGQWRCTECGKVTKRSYPKAPVQKCNEIKPAGLGDRIASGLSAIGITKDRVSRVIGRPCGCGKRQAKLNRLGECVAKGAKKLGAKLSAK